MRRALAAILVIACSAFPAARDLQLFQRDVYLMGTRAALAVYAPDRPTGIAVLESALGVLERTEQELSTWRRDSALSRLNQTPLGEPWHAGGSLCRLVGDLLDWHAQTEGTFDPAIGALGAAWQIHAGGRVPDESQLADARGRSGLHLLEFDAARCTVARRADVSIDAGAFGKGEALDRVASVMAGQAWMIDLGGQVAVGGPRPGNQPWVIDVAHPLHRQRAVLQIALSSGSLATSGGSERDLQVNGVRIGHILDPRTGRAAAFTGSTVVWHERALVADILSTALHVMGPEEGLRWAESRGIAAAYLVADSGGVRTVATAAFSRLAPTAPE